MNKLSAKIYKLSDLQREFPNMDFQWISIVEKITNKLTNEWNFVGGCVRDSLLGIKTYDIDINTLAEPEEIIENLKDFNMSLVGKRFGTIGVFYKKWKIEITTTREDVRTYGRKADVQFVTSFQQDSQRRDFTINALMLNKKDLIITDYINGIEDLKIKEIRFINNADTRIKEDYLRILRYVRFFCRFSENLANSIYEDVIKSNINGLLNISIERIISEIYAMCQYPNTSIAISMLNNLGISKLIFKFDLNSEIKDSWSKDKKMGYIFLHLDVSIWKKLPIMKTAKIYLQTYILKYSNLEINFAFIWNRFHSIESAYLFLEIYNDLHNTNLQIKIEEYDEVNYSELLEDFPISEKTFASIIIKYLQMKQIPVLKKNISKYLYLVNS